MAVSSSGTAPIGVIGCRRVLPPEFPIGLSENSGNLIHANAPIAMFPTAVDQPPRGSGLAFHDWVNQNCSHLIFCFANLVRFDLPDPQRYINARKTIERYRVPLVVFGLGAQAVSEEIEQLTLPAEGIDFLKALADRTPVIGVRGQFSADSIKHIAGIDNVAVTGCPSFFSRPAAFDMLDHNLNELSGWRPAYAATALKDPAEARLIAKAIKQDAHWIEPVQASTTAYAVSIQRGQSAPLPWQLVPLFDSGELTKEQFRDYFERRFHLFRTVEAWYEFNESQVGWTTGTRFHVNMASLLSGLPTLWITHDSRTRELTDFLKVPRLPLAEAADMSFDELRESIDFTECFQALPELFATWNRYLAIHNLPPVPLPEICATA